GVSLAACGGGAGGGGSISAAEKGTTAREGGREIKTGGGQAINLAAHNRWKEGVAAFKAADKQGWNDARCDEVAGKFESGAEAQNKFAEAYYMAGTAHNKCGRKQKAVGFFQKAIRQNPKFCKARVAIGLDDLDGGRESSAQQEFDGAVHDDPQCTEGYVNIA